MQITTPKRRRRGAQVTGAPAVVNATPAANVSARVTIARQPQTLFGGRVRIVHGASSLAPVVVPKNLHTAPVPSALSSGRTRFLKGRPSHLVSTPAPFLRRSTPVTRHPSLLRAPSFISRSVRQSVSVVRSTQVNLNRVSSTILPGESVNLSGGGFSSGCSVLLQAIDTSGMVEDAINPPLLSVSATVIQIQIPLSWAPGLYAVTVIDTVGNASQTRYINQSTGRRFNIDSIAQGGTLEVWGRNLAQPGYSSSLTFVDGGGGRTPATIIEADQNHLSCVVPAGLTVGAPYSVLISNGFGGSLGETPVTATLAIRAVGNDYLDLGVAWAAEFSWLDSRSNSLAANYLSIANCYNVISYGADNTGATDSGVAFRNAMAAASADASGGGIVYVPAGTYLLTSTASGAMLKMPNNVIVAGDGRGATILNCGVVGNSSLDPIHLFGFGGSGSSHVGFKDLYIVNIGQGAIIQTTGTFPADHIFFKNVQLDCNTGTQAFVTNVSYLLFLDCIYNNISTTDGAWYLQANDWMVLRGNQANYRRGRVLITNCTNTIIEGNTFQIDGAYRMVGATPSSGGLEASWTPQCVIQRNTFNTLNFATATAVTGDYEAVVMQNSKGDEAFVAHGTATAATSNSLTDSTATWPISLFAGYYGNAVPVGQTIFMLSGIGAGQVRAVTGITSNSVTVSPAWDFTPQAGDIYALGSVSADRAFLLNNTVINNLDYFANIYYGAVELTITGNTITTAVDMPTANKPSGIFLFAVQNNRAYTDGYSPDPSVTTQTQQICPVFDCLVIGNTITNAQPGVITTIEIEVFVIGGVQPYEIAVANEFRHNSIVDASVPNFGSGYRVITSNGNPSGIPAFTSPVLVGTILEGNLALNLPVHTSYTASPGYNLSAFQGQTIIVAGMNSVGVITGLPSVLVPGQVVFIQGSGFNSGTKIILTNGAGDSTTLTTTILSPTLLSVTIPAGWAWGEWTLAASNGVDESAAFNVNVNVSGTLALLDYPRPDMTEPPLSIVRKARDIHSNLHNQQFVFQWPGTLSYTLYPINFSTDFSALNGWENIKLRLSDWNYKAEWWTESPEGTRADLGPYDYFQHVKVLNSNLPTGYPYGNNGSGGLVQAGGGFALTNMQDLIDTGIQIANQNLQTRESVIALQSKIAYPANQGFCLRFYIDGRQTYKRAAIIDFYFGQYKLTLNTDSMAQLFFSGDNVNYDPVLSFPWTEDGYVHGRHHSIMIQPHGRQHIEILVKRQFASFNDSRSTLIVDSAGESLSKDYGACYIVPGQPAPDSNGFYTITNAAPIMVGMHREFRPHLQVSRLCYSNGSPAFPAYLYDAPQPLEFLPNAQFTGNIDMDLNGGTALWYAIDPATFQAWVPGGSDQITFGLQMKGIGDIPGVGLGSSVTPEFYAYALDKPAIFNTIPRNQVAAPPQTVSIDFGDQAESETARLTFDNSVGDMNANTRQGQLEAFTQRGDIPVRVINASNGIVLFDGKSHLTRVREYRPRALTLDCQGMIEPFLRKTWTYNVPNFGIDPKDAQMRGWFWPDAVRKMFECGGVPNYKVVIENEAAYTFRLWSESGGGSRGAAGSSDSHFASSGGRFRPAPGRHIVESLNHLLRDLLGWSYSYSRRLDEWHIYKRPHPFVSAEMAAITPSVGFYSTSTRARQMPDGIPAYGLMEFEQEVKKPIFTTIEVQNGLREDGFGYDPANSFWINVQKTLAQQNQAAIDPSQTVTNRNIFTWATNPGCYLPQYNPNPPGGPVIINPDWIGEQRFGMRPVSLPNRECMEWYARMACFALCYGQISGTFKAFWGDAYTAYLRKWDAIYIDSGPNYESEIWFIDRIEPDYGSDQVQLATYRVNKLRGVCPPPY